MICIVTRIIQESITTFCRVAHLSLIVRMQNAVCVSVLMSEGLDYCRILTFFLISKVKISFEMSVAPLVEHLFFWPQL